MLARAVIRERGHERVVPRPSGPNRLVGSSEVLTWYRRSEAARRRVAQAENSTALDDDRGHVYLFNRLAIFGVESTQRRCNMFV